MREALYPLRFEPIFKSAMWGGNSLRGMFNQPAASEPEGEAWVLSDHGDSVSRVADGPLAGKTLRELMATYQRELIGNASSWNGRFPLLLKFLDSRLPLSVQVHPNDNQAREMEPASASLGKTEAWVVLKANPGSLLYAGLRSGVGNAEFRLNIKSGELQRVLHAFEPETGDCVFLEAGTIHAIGGGLVLFEVQQTSDITYRLYDWGRVDAKTGQPRQLHVEQALKCSDLGRGPCDPVEPVQLDDQRERLVDCQYFTLDRVKGNKPFAVGVPGQCRIVVVVEGSAAVHHGNTTYPLKLGDVLLLPATIAPGECVPQGNATILECTAH